MLLWMIIKYYCVNEIIYYFFREYYVILVKWVKVCIVCSKIILGYVCLMKKVVFKSIFVDILLVLDFSFLSFDNIYICDLCILIIKKN